MASGLFSLGRASLAMEEECTVNQPKGDVVMGGGGGHRPALYQQWHTESDGFGIGAVYQ